MVWERPVFIEINLDFGFKSDQRNAYFQPIEPWTILRPLKRTSRTMGKGRRNFAAT